MNRFFLQAVGILSLPILMTAAQPKTTLSDQQGYRPGDSKNLEYGRFTDFRSSIKEFRELFALMKMTLKHNQVIFQGKTGPVSGFAAGSAYPQVWLRDAATIIPASKYLYDGSFLRSWLIEHLSYQKADGSLEDWIDSRGRSDKNTTETDQETSAVLAAFQISQISGPGWLKEKISGETVLARLEKALLFVLNHRFDKAHGLVIGAHTADWGDVDMGHADEKAIYVDAETHWTCDIYDQSQFYGAARGLASMLSALGLSDRGRFWLEKGALLQKNTDKWLWREDKGFYKVHIHLDGLRHDFAENDMFAMGGNAEALLWGLASEDKCPRIIENALVRQKVFNVSTISGSLLPPYPKGFFKHPAMSDPYEYQNGGQWDWFGGKLISAMFEHGFSREAREKLLEIAKKDLANRGLYEWDTPDGKGRGSAYYSGSAGSLAKALFEGYFGIKISPDSLALEPKLGKDSAVIHVYVPAAGIFAAYSYHWDRAEQKLTLGYNSNFQGQGKIKLLAPWFPPGLPADSGRIKIEAKRDGVAIPFRQFLLHNDKFIIIETDFKNHILEVHIIR